MKERFARVEEMVAKGVRRYLDYPGEPALEDVSTGLERLLGLHWKHKALTPEKVFDGLARSVLTPKGSVELAVLGLMVTLETQEVEWFSADLILVPEQEELRSYTLKHGVMGVAPVPFEAMDQLWLQGTIDSAPSWKWAHVFTKDDAP